MGNKVLVTGGAGFIGSHVAEELLRAGHDVIVLDDLSGGFEDNVPDGALFVRASITDHSAVHKVFLDNEISHVFHLAAYAAEGLSHFIKRFNYMNNVVGSVNLINEAVNNDVQCFAFTSSIAVYGSAQLPMTEDMTPFPEDSYGIAKYAVERELSVTREIFGLNYVIFRPHNVYGERQNTGDKYRNVIGIFMNQLMQGKSLTVFGTGEQSRAFTYIGDIAPIIARSAFESRAYNQVFNIGADTPCSVNTLAEKVMDAMQMRGQITYLKERNEVAHAYSDHTKVKEVFGFEPKFSLEEGLGRMANWAKEVGSRKSKGFEDIEITRGLPEGW